MTSKQKGALIIILCSTYALWYATGYISGYLAGTGETNELLRDEWEKGRKEGQREGTIAASAPSDS